NHSGFQGTPGNPGYEDLDVQRQLLPRPFELHVEVAQAPVIGTVLPRLLAVDVEDEVASGFSNDSDLVAIGIDGHPVGGVELIAVPLRGPGSRRGLRLRLRPLIGGEPPSISAEADVLYPAFVGELRDAVHVIRWSGVDREGVPVAGHSPSDVAVH